MQLKIYILFCLFWAPTYLAFGGTRNLESIPNKDLNKITNYFKDLNDGKHRKYLVSKVSKIFKELGPEFKHETKLIELQTKINKTPFRFKNCKYDSKHFKSVVAKYNLMQVLVFCHKKIIDQKNENDLDNSEIGFITNFYRELVESKNLGLLNLRSNRAIYPKILASVISLNHYDIDEITDIFQSTYAGKHIIYGSELTEHLQKTGLFPMKESKIFRKEFRLLTTKFSEEEDHLLRDEYLEQILSFYSENKTLIGHKFSNRKFRQISRHLVRNGQTVVAKRFISRALETQSEEHRSNLYFERIYIDLFNKDIKSAQKYINRSGLLGMEAQFSSQLRFWIGKIFVDCGEKSIAEFIFKSQITKKPLNYYSILSAAYLQKLGQNEFLEKNYLYSGTQKLTIFNHSIKESNISFPRLRLWMKAETENLARLEIKEIFNNEAKPTKNSRNLASTNSNSKASLQILQLFHEEEEYLDSFKFFNKNNLMSNFSFLPTATKILFPTPYEDEILKNSSNLDPILVFSLVRQESAFNPLAISSAGARGLMQLMPDTARMFKKRIRKSDLFKPNLNLSIGTKLLEQLLAKYDKSLVHTLAAYNAGETNLKRWQKKYFREHNDLLKVESIPFEETEGYIKYITRNIFFYEIIFGKPQFSSLDWVTKAI